MQPIDVSISDDGVPGIGTMRAMPAVTYVMPRWYKPYAILTHSCSIQPLGFALSPNLRVNYIALFCVLLAEIRNSCTGNAAPLRRHFAGSCSFCTGSW